MLLPIVRGDVDRVRCEYLVESVGEKTDDAQGLAERDTGEVDGDPLGGEVRVKENIDARELRDGLIDELGVLGSHMQGDEVRRNGFKFGGRGKQRNLIHERRR